MNREEYCEAAKLLAHDLDDVDDLFEDAMRLANDRSASEADLRINEGDHPLSGFRMKGFIVDTRPAALFLAGAFARSQEQRNRVHEHALALIGSSDNANRYVTHTLSHLKAVDDRDLPLLAIQPDYTLRSLAALAWAHSSSAAPTVGQRLCEDTDPRVRRALARALADTPSNPAAANLKQRLITDPCHSIRRLVSEACPTQ